MAKALKRTNREGNYEIGLISCPGSSGARLLQESAAQTYRQGNADRRLHVDEDGLNCENRNDLQIVLQTSCVDELEIEVGILRGELAVTPAGPDAQREGAERASLGHARADNAKS